MRLEEELDRLYQVPLADFVAARNDLSKRLRAEGDREKADEVKKLAKPSLTAWVVNQLHFQAPASLASLLEAGKQMRTAISAGAAAHQAALAVRREAIGELLAIADEMTSGGQPLTRLHRQRLTRSLEAIAGGDTGAVPGRLDRDPEPPGFDAFSALAASLGPSPSVRAPSLEDSPPAAASELPEPDTSDEPRSEPAAVVDLESERRARARKIREEKLAAARRRVAEAAEKHTDIERFAGEARTALAGAERRRDEAKTEVDEAERRVQEARRELEAVTEEVAAKRRDADAASASLQRLSEELATCEEELRQLAGSTGPE